MRLLKDIQNSIADSGDSILMATLVLLVAQSPPLCHIGLKEELMWETGPITVG